MNRLFVITFIILFFSSTISAFAGNVYEIVSRNDWEVIETRHVASLRGGVEVFGWMTGNKALIKNGEGKVNILQFERAILSGPLVINGRKIVSKGGTLLNNSIDTNELGTIEVYYRARKKTVMVFLTKSQIKQLEAMIPVSEK